MPLVITSRDFANEGALPSRFTCEGDNVSPGLEWQGVPERARSLALIADDPDAPDPAAPRRTWVHWVLYNLPASSDGLSTAIPSRQLPGQTLQGKNDWGRTSYGGPCPPIGRHRYFFKLYALDVMLPDLHLPTKAQLLAAMDGHVLGEAQVMGTYKKVK
jgi:Raf kinase inhibitor-like YbhB/YbcL family protein